MAMNKYYYHESIQDERLEENMKAINTIFGKDELLFEKDPLEDTKDIKEAELLELKKLISDLRSERTEEAPKGGKVLKKSLHKPKMSEDIEQIVSSFISCFVLALVTATIGTGWLLYIINHI